MEKMVTKLRTARFLGFALTLGVAWAHGQTPGPSPEKKSGDVFKNLKVLNDTPSDLLLPSMQFITSSLGVHCEYCHVENAFAKDDKKPKQTAREMMRMVEEINRTKFQGKQEVTCYSCHRGSPKPLTVPVIADATPRLASSSVSDNPRDVANQPSSHDVLSKYITARGGASALGSLTNLEERGTFESDSRRFPVELYLTKSGQSATTIHLNGTDRISAFEGTTGWIVIPGRPIRVMSSAEMDAARLDAAFQFGLDLNTIFPEIRFKEFSKLSTAKSVVLSGQRPGLPPVEMYFDITSGLVLRSVYYSTSTLGLNPIQTDYSDYRRVGAVKVPFHWTSSTPTGRFSVQITTVRVNVSIPKEVFSKPRGE